MTQRHLPRHDHDPFDRLLVAKSQMKGLTSVGDDELLARYDVDVLW
jgi:PIN domain nuclease of toxin-antitoxin system